MPLRLPLLLAAACLLLGSSSAQSSSWSSGLAAHCGRNRFDESFMQYLATNKRSGGGQTIDKRIVGGQLTRNGEWPWLVSMRYITGSGEAKPACGGTLIHPRWVLTAAHCFRLSREQHDLPSSWIMRVGEHNMMFDDKTHVDVRVERLFLHPLSQNGYNNSYDIALVKLQQAVPIEEDQNVACLPSPNDNFRPGTVCYTVGWGRVVQGGSGSPILRHVAVPLVSQSRCTDAYSETRVRYITRFGRRIRIVERQSSVTDRSMCAGITGRDSCQGDSGGPLVCRNPRDRSQWLLAGVVSFGRGCGVRGYPGVYAKVTYFLPWINRVISENQ